MKKLSNLKKKKQEVFYLQCKLKEEEMTKNLGTGINIVPIFYEIFSMKYIENLNSKVDIREKGS